MVVENPLEYIAAIQDVVAVVSNGRLAVKPAALRSPVAAGPAAPSAQYAGDAALTGERGRAGASVAITVAAQALPAAGHSYGPSLRATATSRGPKGTGRR